MCILAGVGVAFRILEKVGTVPKDGWRNWIFSEHIVKNTYIPPRKQVCALVFGFLASGRKRGRQKMELLISLTSPCCCCSARSGQHSSYDECLISWNTSQIAKLYLPWIAKCILFCSVVKKTTVDNGTALSSQTKQCCPLIFCLFEANLFLFQKHVLAWRNILGFLQNKGKNLPEKTFKLESAFKFKIITVFDFKQMAYLHNETACDRRTVWAWKSSPPEKKMLNWLVSCPSWQQHRQPDGADRQTH